MDKMSTKFHNAWADSVTKFKSADMNAPLKQIDLAAWRLANLTVKDRGLTAPPGTPADGDCYIIGGPTATGVWAGSVGKISYWDADQAEWVIVTPEEGWTVYVQDEDTELLYSGSAWSKKAPYIVAAFYPGVLAASALCLRHSSVFAVDFPVDLAGSYSKSGAVATAETVFSVQKNASEFGTITFAISGATGTFVAASATSFAAGDVLAIVGPATADATLADVDFELKGLR
jgi:hypothetical protein